MTLKLSTGLRNAVLDSTGLAKALKDGVIYIYDGPQPLTADAPVQGTLLGIVTQNAGAWVAGSPTNGLEFDPASGGNLNKAAAETWQFTGLANSIAGWCRFVGNAADAGGSSSTLPRMDMDIGQGSGTISLSSANIAVGAVETITGLLVTLPPQ